MYQQDRRGQEMAEIIEMLRGMGLLLPGYFGAVLIYAIYIAIKNR